MAAGSGGAGAGGQGDGGTPLPARLEATLARLVPGYPAAALCVALSGGVDSSALLHAAAALAATQPALRLRAIHVHHGLQRDADGWVDDCEALCARLGVPLTVERLALDPPRGSSREAEARDARYAALARRLAPRECLLTAHHQDDQLETVLLQLLRGAGVAGLAAMPASTGLGPGLHLRPLLDVPRADIVAYARAAGLRWVEDPMNADQRYDRAWLRHQVLPALRARWPAAGTTVGRSARHLAEARALLGDLALADGATLIDAAGRLEAAGLLTLPRARQRNLLRGWLASEGLGMPSSARLAAILDDVAPARPDARPVVTWEAGEVRRYRGRLYAMRPLGKAPDGRWALVPGQTLTVEGMGTVTLVATTGEGIDAARFPGPFEVRFRQGGERLRPVGQPLERPLKRWLQEAGVEPWLRARLPLVYAGEQLLAVGERWVAAGVEARPGTPGWRLACGS